jgi:hypothetical protein
VASACRSAAEVGGTGTAAGWRDHVVEAFRPSIPGFDGGWVTGARDCHYLARTATGGPMLVGLGGAALAYAACGGSSFKFAPLIARSLVRRASGQTPASTGLRAVDEPAGQFVPGR